MTCAKQMILTLTVVEYYLLGKQERGNRSGKLEIK